MSAVNQLGELGSYTSPLALGGDSLADLLDLAAPPAWMKEALCAQVDIGDIFYPDKGGSATIAKNVCAQCPVRQVCLDYSLASNERFGVWGGLTARERREYQRTEEAA